MGSQRVLYGTTYTIPGACSGEFGCGSVYALSGVGGTGYTVLYSPSIPGLSSAPLAIGEGGEIYGAIYGGACPSAACGLVFELSPPSAASGAWTETILHTFTGGGDGGGPTGVVLGPNGVIYGTTAYGGASPCGDTSLPGCGTVFMLTPPTIPGGAWTKSVLYAFTGSQGDGVVPSASLAFGPNGAIYGTTLGGGMPARDCNYGCGTVFMLTPPSTRGADWTESVLYDFAGGSDGGQPNIVITGPGGVLYGTTYETVFQLTPPSVAAGAWTKTVLHSFKVHEGRRPTSLLAGRNGALYGTNHQGGGRDHGTTFGTIFELLPPGSAGGAWTANVLYDFTDHNVAGGRPVGMTLSPEGAFYGATYGAIFKLRP